MEISEEGSEINEEESPLKAHTDKTQRKKRHSVSHNFASFITNEILFYKK